MVQQQPTPDYSNEIFSDIAVKLRDIEEKQNLIKDRVLLIGENLVSEKEETNSEIADINFQLSNLNGEIKRLKLILERIIEETNNFARKTETDILKRQFEMFQPMNLARISDIEAIVKRELKKQAKN